MIVGHHILYGKIQDMEKPFLAMVKKKFESQEEETSYDSVEKMDVDKDSSGSTEYTVKAVIKKKIVFKTRPKPIIANVPKKI